VRVRAHSRLAPLAGSGVGSEGFYREATMPRIAAEDVAVAGVVGAGGAGFPTHVKLAARADTLLINAANVSPCCTRTRRCFASTPTS